MSTRTPHYADWAMLGYQTWLLGVEASFVIATRLSGFAWQAPGSDKEAVRMVSEKIAAITELQMRYLTGGMGTTPLAAGQNTVRHYRRKVAANRRRLSR
ncbi:hypothetical protein COC42_02450 [Sphingomonas spermidinifaciens]|uniref:Antifreeze protein n=1 Tax=Sphingomonas spermidinifaciens TaxID=1141889 RepID=A0A2A4B5E4_9SPHN|nr:hypothetical protein [Sphingomonas spermidinifaciens]PCD03287.1 hypothetical protein COC42_02450 [Sphingomonas spermidinifaciens]